MTDAELIDDFISNFERTAKHFPEWLLAQQECNRRTEKLKAEIEKSEQR